MRLPVYLDNHATTPVDPRVLEAMLPYLTEKFGNASSRSHVFGWEARQAVEDARRQVAALVNAEPKEIVFTSGATESDNIAIKGVAWAQRERGDHILTCVTEHEAVLDPCRRLDREGFTVTYLPVDRSGLIRMDDVRQAMTGRTVLVTLMAANNEIGVLHPIAEIGALCRQRGVLFHTDAAQALGKVPFDVQAMNVDLASFCGHKMYAPKGVGALYVRDGLKLEMLMEGGGQERGIRSGTLAVPGIVAFGKACEIAAAEMAAEAGRIGCLRDRLCGGISDRLSGIHINGDMSRRLPGNLNASFAGVEAEELMMAINDIAVSTGAACNSAQRQPSYVLRALGIEDELAQASIRFGIGRFNTEEEIDYTVERVCEAVGQLRQLAAPATAAPAAAQSGEQP